MRCCLQHSANSSFANFSSFARQSLQFPLPRFIQQGHLKQWKGGVGGKVCLLRFQKGLEKETSISLLPVTEGGGAHAFPLPLSQTPWRERLSNLQTRLPGHHCTRNPVPPHPHSTPSPLQQMRIMKEGDSWASH